MKNPNCWRQPTPTDLNNDENLTFLERSLFREILSLCQNKKKLLRFVHANRDYSIELNRGQCVLKVSKIAKELKIGRKKVRRSIEILQKWYNGMDIKAMPFGLIITVKGYDDIVKMDNGMDNKGTIKAQWRHNKGTTNKNVLESVKSVKDNTYISSSTHKKYTLEELAKIYVDLFNKVMKTKYKSIKAILKGLEYWLQTYEIPDIEIAIRNIPSNKFWKDKMTPTILFRRKNPQGEDVDYIGSLLNH